MVLLGATSMLVIGSIGTSAAAAVDGWPSGSSYAQAPDWTSCHDGGYGVFNDAGDRFSIHDSCKDGHGVAIQVDVDPIGEGEIYDFMYNYTGGVGAGRTVQRNLPEGTAVVVRACLASGSSVWNCGDWERGTA